MITKFKIYESLDDLPVYDQQFSDFYEYRGVYFCRVREIGGKIHYEFMLPSEEDDEITSFETGETVQKESEDLTIDCCDFYRDRDQLDSESMNDIKRKIDYYFIMQTPEGREAEKYNL